MPGLALIKHWLTAAAFKVQERTTSGRAESRCWARNDQHSSVLIKILKCGRIIIRGSCAFGNKNHLQLSRNVVSHW